MLSALQFLGELISAELSSASESIQPGLINLGRSKFEFDSAHVKYGVWTGPNYINLIKKTISDVSNDYKEDERVDPILLWDVMKMQIRASSIKYAKKYKAKQS